MVRARDKAGAGLAKGLGLGARALNFHDLTVAA